MQQSIEKKQIPLHIKTAVSQFNILPNLEKINTEKSSEQNIEKVREILFGSQIKLHQQQISAYELKNQENLTELRQTLLSRLDDFEILFKSEIKNLNYRLKSGQDLRLQSEEKNQSELSDLKSLMFKRTQQLSEDISASKIQTTQDFKKELEILDQQKVERSQFSNFMTDWAQRFENRIEANSGTSK